MSKKATPVTLASIIVLERSHILSAKDIVAKKTKWINAEIAAFAAKHPRDESHGAAFVNHLRKVIVAECKTVAALPVKDGGMGAKAKGLAEMSDWDVIETVLDATARRTWKSYVSGARLAFVTSIDWTPGIYAQVKKADAKKPGPVEKKDPATASPEGQPKQSTQPATPDTVKTDALGAVIRAAMQTADRTAELLAFARAKGWI